MPAVWKPRWFGSSDKQALRRAGLNFLAARCQTLCTNGEMIDATT